MPNVPVYQQTTRLQAAPFVPQSAAGATPDAFGAASGRALENSARQLNAVSNSFTADAVQEKREDETRQLKQADVALRAKLDTLAVGDGTADNPGWGSLQGDNALNSAKDVQEKIQKARREVLDGIENSRVKQLFDQISAADEQKEIRGLNLHVTQQRTVANVNTSVARIDSNINSASARWNDDEVRNKALEVIGNEVDAIAKFKGYNEEQKQQLLDDQTGKLWSNVIKSASRFDATTGERLFRQNLDAIPGTAQPGIAREVKADLNAERVAREHQLALEDRARKKRIESAEDKWITALLNGDPVDIKAVANDPNLKDAPAQKLTIQRAIEADARGESSAAVSARVAGPLFARIHLPDGDPDKIIDESQLTPEYGPGGLNRADLGWLRKEVQDARTPEGSRLGKTQSDFLKGVKTMIDKSNPLMGGANDPEGPMKFWAYTQWVDSKVKEARKKGEDPYELFNAASPKFVGSPAAIAPFQKSMQESLQTIQQSISRPPSSPLVTPGTPGTEVDYGSLADLQAAVKAGKVPRGKAETIAKEKGWIK